MSVVIESLRHLWDNWGPRMHDIMDCCLKTIYEYNDHHDTTPEEMLTMLDILPLLAFETPPGRRPTGLAPLSEFQKRVLQRVSDPDLLMRFDRYSRWSEQLRNDAFAPVETRVSGFASDEDPRAIMGQWETTIDFAEVIREGLILLVNTARGTVGPYVSSLMGSSIVSLIDAALREQETMERARAPQLPAGRRRVPLHNRRQLGGPAGRDQEVRRHGPAHHAGTRAPRHQRTQAQSRRARQLRRSGVLSDVRRGRLPGR